jgi:hypothetical protein
MSSVKVAVRVRPFNSREIQRNSKSAIEMRGNQTIITGGPKVFLRIFSLIINNRDDKKNNDDSDDNDGNDDNDDNDDNDNNDYDNGNRESKTHSHSTTRIGRLIRRTDTSHHKRRCIMTSEGTCLIIPLRATTLACSRTVRRALERVTQ